MRMAVEGSGSLADWHRKHKREAVMWSASIWRKWAGTGLSQVEGIRGRSQ